MICGRKSDFHIIMEKKLLFLILKMHKKRVFYFHG